MTETRCVHCGNEYRDEKEQCPTCGSRQFDEPFEEFTVERIGEALSQVPRALPLREIYKGQRPPPKPLPPLRRLQEADEVARPIPSALPGDTFGGDEDNVMGNLQALIFAVSIAVGGVGLFLVITHLIAWAAGQ